jgi:hypothetical protein
MVGVGFAAGAFISTSLVLMLSARTRPLPAGGARAERPAIAPGPRGQVVLPSPIVGPRRPAPRVATAVVAVPPPAPIVAPPAPGVVPPLEEEAPEQPPVVSSEELQRLRKEFRRQRVLRLQTIMEGVRRTCRSTDWQRNGWRDYRLEFALDEWIYRVKKAVQRPALKLPVRFGEVPAGVAENAKNVLTATHSLKLSSATRCLFLVDGDVDLQSARDCVILATGHVKVDYGHRNVILAGGAIEGAENSPRPDEKRGLSLRISGTTLSARYSTDLIFGAAGNVEAMSVERSALFNSPMRSLSYLNECSEYTSPLVDLWVDPLLVPGGRVAGPELPNGGAAKPPRRRGR